MDNAGFHRSQRAKKLIESVGCQVIFLPPYSPVI
ncbi:transposase [Holospora obtusa]